MNKSLKTSSFQTNTEYFCLFPLLSIFFLIWISISLPFSPPPPPPPDIFFHRPPARQSRFTMLYYYNKDDGVSVSPVRKTWHASQRRDRCWHIQQLLADDRWRCRMILRSESTDIYVYELRAGKICLGIWMYWFVILYGELFFVSRHEQSFYVSVINAHVVSRVSHYIEIRMWKCNVRWRDFSPFANR